MQAYLASLSPDSSDLEEIARQPEDSRATHLQHELREVTAFKVVSKEMISDDVVILTLFFDGVEDEARFKLRRIGQEWKFVDVVKGNRQSP